MLCVLCYCAHKATRFARTAARQHGALLPAWLLYFPACRLGDVRLATLSPTTGDDVDAPLIELSSSAYDAHLGCLSWENVNYSNPVELASKRRLGRRLCRPRGLLDGQPGLAVSASKQKYHLPHRPIQHYQACLVRRLNWRRCGLWEHELRSTNPFSKSNPIRANEAATPVWLCSYPMPPTYVTLEAPLVACIYLQTPARCLKTDWRILNQDGQMVRRSLGKQFGLFGTRQLLVNDVRAVK